MPKTVLIIEDSDVIGGALQQLIELEGYEAILADQGSTGLELARTRRPDLILVDVRLPDTDGFEITRQIRAIPELSRTPVVCVSSYVTGFETEARLAGCTDVFTKTTFIQDFPDNVKKYLEDSEQAAVGTN